MATAATKVPIGNAAALANGMTSSGADSSSLVECHALPCCIKYDGTAQVSIHFQPEVRQLQRQRQVNETSSDKNPGDNNVFYTAQFRGRGLIAKEPEQTTVGKASLHNNDNNVGNSSTTTRNNDNNNTTSPMLQGKVMSISSINDDKTVAVLQESFECFYEWHHSHQVDALLLRSSTRVQKANEWSQVAQALHDPLPIIMDS